MDIAKTYLSTVIGLTHLLCITMSNLSTYNGTQRHSKPSNAGLCTGDPEYHMQVE